jgi:predicted metal-binding membrane protein
MSTEVKKECPKCKEPMHGIITNVDQHGKQLPQAVRKGFFCFGCKCWLDATGEEKNL